METDIERIKYYAGSLIRGFGFSDRGLLNVTDFRRPTLYRCSTCLMPLEMCYRSGTLMLDPGPLIDRLSEKTRRTNV